MNKGPSTSRSTLRVPLVSFWDENAVIAFLEMGEEVDGHKSCKT